MNLMSRKVFSAEVLLAGLGDDPESTDVVAQVQFKSHGRAEEPRDLAGFLGMSVVATLRGCRSAPTHARPFLDICSELADGLLVWNPSSTEPFSLRQVIGEPLFDQEGLALIYDGGAASEEMIDSWLRQCLPRVGAERTGGHRRKFKAVLKQPRRAGAVPFVAPWSRNSFLAIQGTLAMYEAAALSRDYHTTTRPAAATLRRLLDFNEEAFRGELPGFGETTWLYQLAGTAAVAEDPLTCEPPRFSGTDSSGEESMMMLKLGRWARESGLDADAAAREITRRTQAGEPMPWDAR